MVLPIEHMEISEFPKSEVVVYASSMYYLFDGKEDFFMKRKKIAYLFYLIMILAGFGLVTQLFGNTRGFLTSMFMMLGFAVAIFALLYFLVNRSRGSSDEMKKYKQAVKQSKSKYNQAAPKKPAHVPAINKKAATARKVKKRPTHLRVIEGNKSKEKDRATF